MAAGIIQFGLWLADEIIRRRISTAQFGRTAGISHSIIGRWIRGETASIYPHTLHKLADGLGMPPVELIAIYDRMVADAPPPVDLIPTYPWPVACGDWYHHGEDAQGILTPQQRSAGVKSFHVHLTGHSMAPMWPSGAVVEFTPCTAALPTIPGHDYLFFRTDHACTMKRLHHIDPDIGYMLRAINHKYPKPLTLTWDECAAIAAPLGIIPPPKAKSQSHPYPPIIS